MGTECLYISQQALASEIANAISACGFINRGDKKRTDLYFLNQTEMPSILIEVCFVDSTADAAIYDSKFDQICEAIATVLGGKERVIGV
jgi:N-acetylmuramoyl-L-alanine amidase